MKKLLIIEDDIAFADLLKAKLSDTYQVELCPDGQSGYYAIYEYRPDVVLLDLTIEQMNAVSLVGKMRVQKQFQKLPILVLADAKTMGLADDAIAAGANEAFLKDESGTITTIVSALSELFKPSLARRSQAEAIRAPVIVHNLPIALPPARPAVEVREPAAPVWRNTTPIPEVSQFATSCHGVYERPLVNVPEENENIFGGQFNSASNIFLDSYGQKAHSIRQEFIRYRTTTGSERKNAYQNFVEGVASLNAEALDSGFIGLTRYLTSLETRVKQLLTSIEEISLPTLQILAGALDMLAALDNHLTELAPLNNTAPHAMVVDDENVSRKALCLGLEKSKIKTTSVDNPDAAIQEAEHKPFDIIFLDVDLPKMNGFALCARIRIISQHRKTPILFVTSLNDVKSRASSRVSGGNQFLTKPVNFAELSINAWTLVLRKRILEDGKQQHRQRA